MVNTESTSISPSWHYINSLRRAKTKPGAGGKLHVYHDSEVLNQSIDAPVLIEDFQTYSIWFKPAGVLSQGSRWGDHCTINRWIETHDPRQRPAFIVHRLDRAACGLMIIAHGKKTAGHFGQLFESRDIEKVYRARVRGLLEADLPVLLEAPVDNKPALTTVLAAQQDIKSGSSLLTLRIDSGRKHQIRQHLAALGYPIIGDRLYGDDQQGDLQLCAFSLTFEDPIAGTIRSFKVPSQLLPALLCE